jgi:diadenosine tetraphosphate (Ap4A) HIT family hydrolase
MPLERFAAAWREQYVQTATAADRRGGSDPCVFCDLATEGASPDTGIITYSAHAFCILNAYPYGSGHLLVLPRRHLQRLDELDEVEANDFFSLLRTAAEALQGAYEPDGMNVGLNLGRAAGAGIPQHLHAHALPRWDGDTNFMTALAETRVLPEGLSSTWAKVRAAWPIAAANGPPVD